MIVCGGVFICRFVQVKRCGHFCSMLHQLHTISNIDYGGTRALNYTYPYEVFNEGAIFFHVVESVVRSCQLDPCTQCKCAIRMKILYISRDSLIFVFDLFIMRWYLMVSECTEPIKVK